MNTKKARISIDGGQLVRNANGTLTIGSGKAFSWIVLFLTGIAGLCFIAIIVSSLINNTGGGFGFDQIFGLLGSVLVIVVLGFLVWFMLRSLRRPAVTFNPETRTITKGKNGSEQILFSEVTKIVTSVINSPMGGAYTGGFHLILKDGSNVDLGSVTVDLMHLGDKMDRVTRILAETLNVPVEPLDLGPGTDTTSP